MYIADRYNARVRKVTVSTGIITTIAGSSSGGTYSGDNGAATSATLNDLHAVTLDSAGKLFFQELFVLLTHSLTHLGNVYIADTNNQRVRKVTISTGIITLIAGTGTASYSGDNGPATSAALNYPVGVALDSAGKFISAFHCYSS